MTRSKLDNENRPAADFETSLLYIGAKGPVCNLQATPRTTQHNLRRNRITQTTMGRLRWGPGDQCADARCERPADGRCNRPVRFGTGEEDNGLPPRCMDCGGIGERRSYWETVKDFHGGRPGRRSGRRRGEGFGIIWSVVWPAAQRPAEREEQMEKLLLKHRAEAAGWR